MLLINEYVHVADTFETQQYQQHRQGQKMEAAAAVPVRSADEDLMCVFDGIGKPVHKSEWNPVQRKPFSRAKWIQV